MTGVTALEKTLIGVEASAGGSTDTPSTHWRGMGKVKDRLEVVNPPERVGKVGGTTRSYIPRKGGEVTLDGDATFEQLCYIKNAGIYATDPTTDAGSAQVWTWNVQVNSTDSLSSSDLDTLVVESGDNNEAERARYCFVREYTESGRQGEALQVNAILGTRAPSTCTFTSVGDTDFQNPAQSILGSLVALYIDDSTGTIGTTQASETYLEHTLRHRTGWVELPARDGRLDFSNVKHIDDEILLDVVFEHTGEAVTEKTAWRNETGRALRLQFTGDDMSTTDAGATYNAYTYRMDLYGKWLTFGAEGLEDQDGDNIYRGTLRVAWDADADEKATFIIANESSVLP